MRLCAKGSSLCGKKRKIERLGRKAITAFTKRLTDEIFLFIERDPALLKEYKEAVKTYSAHSVNATLGKMIAEAYGLGNLQRKAIRTVRS